MPVGEDIDAVVAECDPGVQKYVRALLEAGFTTTDSGDGVSKPAEWYESGEAIPFAHVVVQLACGEDWYEKIEGVRTTLVETFPEDYFRLDFSYDSVQEFPCLFVAINRGEMADQNELTVVGLARRMHETYERVAAGTGWETQESCRVDFSELPPKNRATMLAVAEDVFAFFGMEPFPEA